MAAPKTAAKVRTAKEVALAQKGRDYDKVTSAAWGSTDAAAKYEDEIREQADEIREQAGFDGVMTAPLFLELLPLLRKPLHAGHVIHTTAGKGKPYESNGAKSVQVPIDRCNNVLTPLCWRYVETYDSGGQLCNVSVRVMTAHEGDVLVERSSWGGVNQAQQKGNLYKGSFTNAAKLAFARLGPGREIYSGLLDFDPDTNAGVAAAQTRQSKERDQANDAAQPVQEVDPVKALAELLAEEHPLKELRAQADGGMDVLGAGVRQRLEELQAHGSDKRSLESLMGRIQTALDEQANGNGNGGE